MRVFTAFLFVGVALTGCNQTNSTNSAKVPASAVVPNETARSVRTAAAPDNTEVNKRDAGSNTKTPLDQKENQADVNLAAKIRRQVLDVKDLSIDARNAKIIAADGKVTLRGPVKSLEERDTLERIAREAAGDGNVDNQLDVAATTATNSRR
jgi:osmotically-inducible protein OsmY